MANTATINGNLAHDPELGKTTSGKDFLRLSIALYRPKKDGEDERPAEYVSITLHDGLARNAAKTVVKGSAIVSECYIGVYKTTMYKKDGTEFKGDVTSFTASTFGPDLRFASASITRNPKNGQVNETEAEAAARPAAKSAAATETAAPAAAAPAAAASSSEEEF